jgi:hypothetical protein
MHIGGLRRDGATSQFIEGELLGQYLAPKPPRVLTPHELAFPQPHHAIKLLIPHLNRLGSSLQHGIPRSVDLFGAVIIKKQSQGVGADTVLQLQPVCVNEFVDFQFLVHQDYEATLDKHLVLHLLKVFQFDRSTQYFIKCFKYFIVFIYVEIECLVPSIIGSVHTIPSLVIERA